MTEWQTPCGENQPEAYIVEATTRVGKVCESFATYREALRRVEQLAAEGLIGLPLVFKELPDGSQRLVRNDGKPLQWHRLPTDDPPRPDEPIPLTEQVLDLPPPVEIPPPSDLPDLLDLEDLEREDGS